MPLSKGEELVDEEVELELPVQIPFVQLSRKLQATDFPTVQEEPHVGSISIPN